MPTSIETVSISLSRIIFRKSVILKMAQNNLNGFPFFVETFIIQEHILSHKYKVQQNRCVYITQTTL